MEIPETEPGSASQAGALVPVCFPRSLPCSSSPLLPSLERGPLSFGVSAPSLYTRSGVSSPVPWLQVSALGWRPLSVRDELPLCPGTWVMLELQSAQLWVLRTWLMPRDEQRVSAEHVGPTPGTLPHLTCLPALWPPSCTDFESRVRAPPLLPRAVTHLAQSLLPQRLPSQNLCLSEIEIRE